MKTKRRNETTASAATIVPGGIVSTWWDRSSRNYVTHLLSPNGIELVNPRTGANSEYTGNRIDAKLAHAEWGEAAAKGGA